MEMTKVDYNRGFEEGVKQTKNRIESISIQYINAGLQEMENMNPCHKENQERKIIGMVSLLEKITGNEYYIYEDHVEKED